MEHDAFVFYKSYFEAAADLSAKERLKFYDALTGYALYGKEPDLPKCPARSLFIALKPAIDKGLKTSEKRRKAINARWSSVSDKDDSKRIQTRYKIDTKETDVSSDCNSNEIQNDTLQDTRHKTQDTRLESIPESSSGTRPQKHKHGEYQHVLLTDEESSKLIADYGEAKYNAAVKFLDEYIEMKGYKAKSHYLAIRKWVMDAIKEREQKARSGTSDRHGITRSDDIDAFVRGKVLEGL